MLRKESVQHFQNTVFNAVVELPRKPERDRAAARFTLTNQLLTSYMKNAEGRQEIARISTKPKW